MAKIKLVDTGWAMLPEGQTVLKINDVIYKEDFGKLEIHMITQSGVKHIERYSLIYRNEINEGATKAFSFFAKTALNNFNLEEVDPNDLVGCYVSANVEHVESDTINENTGKPYVNVRLNELKSEVGFKKSAYDQNVEEILEDLDDFLNE